MPACKWCNYPTSRTFSLISLTFFLSLFSDLCPGNLPSLDPSAPWGPSRSHGRLGWPSLILCLVLIWGFWESEWERFASDSHNLLERSRREKKSCISDGYARVKSWLRRLKCFCEFNGLCYRYCCFNLVLVWLLRSITMTEASHHHFLLLWILLVCT